MNKCVTPEFYQFISPPGGETSFVRSLIQALQDNHLRSLINLQLSGIATVVLPTFPPEGIAEYDFNLLRTSLSQCGLQSTHPNQFPSRITRDPANEMLRIIATQARWGQTSLQLSDKEANLFARFLTARGDIYFHDPYMMRNWDSSPDSFGRKLLTALDMQFKSEHSNRSAISPSRIYLIYQANSPSSPALPLPTFCTLIPYRKDRAHKPHLQHARWIATASWGVWTDVGFFDSQYTDSLSSQPIQREICDSMIKLARHLERKSRPTHA